MNKFIIAVEGGTSEQLNAITAYLNTKGSYWHWMSHLWLFIPTDQDMSADAIRDDMTKFLTGDVTRMVFHVGVPHTGDEFTWAGWGDVKSAQWLEKYWKP